MLPSTAQIWQWLEAVPDPEIPVVSVVELGIVRDLAWQDDLLTVTITPTYSGCPATAMISMDIDQALRGHGIDKLKIETRIAPAWTTDWLTPAARDKLKAYGIAPPTAAGGPSECPNCGGGDVARVSQFGSTPCKAQWRCNSCLEPFDYFKCI